MKPVLAACVVRSCTFIPFFDKVGVKLLPASLVSYALTKKRLVPLLTLEFPFDPPSMAGYYLYA